MALLIEPPLLKGEPEGDVAQLEKPVQVRLPPVRFDDGVEATEEHVRKLGAFLYRLGGGGEEIWNEAEQSWQPAPADLAALAALTPVPLQHKPGEPEPWQGVLVAMGLKDKEGNDRFAALSGGAPRYRLRGFADVLRDGMASARLGPPSARIGFVSAAESQRFGAVLEPLKPDQATRVRLQLKNASLAPAGFLEIRANPGQEVEIGNFDASGAPLARLWLAADGSIHLAPGSGASIVLEGDLVARHINYLPAGSATGNVDLG